MIRDVLLILLAILLYVVAIPLLFVILVIFTCLYVSFLPLTFIFDRIPLSSDRILFTIIELWAYIAASTRLPIPYSIMSPTHAAKLLLKLPLAKQLAILECLDKKRAWDILLIIDKRSPAEFSRILSNMDSKRLHDLLLLEPIQRRILIVSKLSIEMDVGVETKSYTTPEV